METNHGTAAAALKALSTAGSVAVVGASSTPGKIGFSALNALVESQTAAELFAVNPRADEVLGVAAYPTIDDLPRRVDYAIIAVPPRFVPETLEAAARNGVAIAQILTSGFDGEGPSGVAVSDLLDAIRGSQLRIMGPNCIGSYVPRAGLSWTPLASGEPGNVAIISQSGGLAYDLLLAGEEERIRYSHVLSIGNCVDLDLPDYIAHLREDPNTEAVGMYVESVADGRRLFEELRATAAHKPVFVLKGGRTARGAASVESHTGRLAGDFSLWETMIRQAGASLVGSAAELLAGLQAVSAPSAAPAASAPRIAEPGTGLALVGNGGGATVLACDSAEERGLALAEIGPETRQRLHDISVETGEVADSNPVDLPLPRLLWDDGRLLGSLLEALAEDVHVDGLLVHLNLLPLASRPEPSQVLKGVMKRLFEVDLSEVRDLYLVFRSDGSETVEALRRIARDAARDEWGVPVFSSMEDAVRGIAASRWQRENRERRSAIGGPNVPTVGGHVHA